MYGPFWMLMPPVSPHDAGPITLRQRLTWCRPRAGLYRTPKRAYPGRNV